MKHQLHAVAVTVSVLAAVPTAGCAGAPGSPPVRGAASAPATGAAATRVAASAAANAQVSGGSACAGAPNSSVTHTVEVAGKVRTFIAHLPAGPAPGAKVPAIIAFPGRGEDAGRLEAYSGLDAVDAVVLYAQGLDGKGGKPSWEATPYLGAEAHDYEFAGDLVRWLAGSGCVDPARIGLAGKSDGAGFAASAGCTLDGVATVATVSGAFYQDVNHCSGRGRPVATLNMHGTADPVIPYDGNPDRGLYSTDAWLRLWQQRDRCTGAGTDQDLAPDVTSTTWSTCADSTVVVNYRIAGGGHTWPGASVSSGPGGTTHSIDAARTILDFLDAHPRTPATG
ncbi:hypothetical protein AB0O91_23925 [Kitasatospora sp. NPDC089797]|uniref:alpha/beta hydrolase family esterase n=1 Tax=Kitasatospora sp. NPDC089797 TaxID=3155298 RepID=UPI003440C390